MLASCATVEPVADSCGWVDWVHPTPAGGAVNDVAQRWTRDELLQDANLRDNICKNCPGRCPAKEQSK